MLSSLFDLVLPLACGGCGASGTAWCRACARTLNDPPALVRLRRDPGVPVWSLGPYTGPRRRAVVAAKERGRRDLADPLGLAWAVAVSRLRRWGELPPGPTTVVPAPTRVRAARARGGDPVSRAAQVAASHDPNLFVHPLLVSARGVRDSVGLSAVDRHRNLAGRIRLREGGVPRTRQVLVVDDIVTTGATAAESVRVLRRGGFDPVGMLVTAHA
ncbi:ComF family protein [Rhodococcus sp. NPDC058639]|uniref:ComF family protein n=1 Tax=unclassified Rhodococcus (in: high G+C Gram-positive bacteria) TaxID=192944 RepID=UPI0036638EC3